MSGGLKLEAQTGRYKEEGVKEKIWGKAAKTKGHLRVCLEKNASYDI